MLFFVSLQKNPKWISDVAKKYLPGNISGTIINKEE